MSERRSSSESAERWTARGKPDAGRCGSITPTTGARSRISVTTGGSCGGGGSAAASATDFLSGFGGGAASGFSVGSLVTRWTCAAGFLLLRKNSACSLRSAASSASPSASSALASMGALATWHRRAKVTIRISIFPHRQLPTSSFAAIKWRQNSSKAQRVAEEVDADEPDLLSALPEELQLRILDFLDSPTDCVNLCLASPRLGMVGMRARLPLFCDPVFAVAMQFATDPDVNREALLRKYAADKGASSTHFEWLKVASPSLYLVEEVVNGETVWKLHDELEFGDDPMLRKLRNGAFYRHYVGGGGHERLVRAFSARNDITAYYEGEKDEERVVRSVDANGDVMHFEGAKGAERKVRFESSSGEVMHLEGAKREERKVKMELTNGDVEHFEGDKGAERIVTIELPNGNAHHYGGEKGEERLVRKDLVDGDVLYYEGERGAERKVRMEHVDGHVMHFEGQKGEERPVRVERP